MEEQQKVSVTTAMNQRYAEDRHMNYSEMLLAFIMT